jgi:hypothetical protein
MTRIHTAFAAIGMLFVATSGLVAPALADVVVKDGSLRDVPHREVRYGDLNLDTQAGIDTLSWINWPACTTAATPRSTGPLRPAMK